MAMNGNSLRCADGSLGRHQHVCAFFNDPDEEHRVLRSFFKDGFERGEKATHIVEADKREDYLKRLAEAGINVEGMMDAGQL
jgi:MEDS: MEthanogen/methylotroph, DcmR Sensory domain